MKSGSLGGGMPGCRRRGESRNIKFNYEIWTDAVKHGDP
jgi:hypothetical protein